MINKDSFYLADIELLKLLQPIMAKKGIEADAYLGDKLEQNNGGYTGDDYVVWSEGIKVYTIRELEEHEWYDNGLNGGYEETQQEWNIECQLKQLLPTWRKDSLEAALPEWLFTLAYREYGPRWDTLEIGFPKQFLEPEINFKMQIRFREYLINRGQESLKALGELIVLLDKEGVE